MTHITVFPYHFIIKYILVHIVHCRVIKLKCALCNVSFIIPYRFLVNVYITKKGLELRNGLGSDLQIKEIIEQKYPQ